MDALRKVSMFPFSTSWKLWFRLACVVCWSCLLPGSSDGLISSSVVSQKAYSCTTTRSEIQLQAINRRRVVYFGIASIVAGADYFSSEPAVAAETIGKDPNCSDPSCLGVWDGLFADCPHGKSNPLFPSGAAGCTSSQDDAPGVFAEPWDYGDTSSLDWEYQMQQLKAAISLATSKRGDKISFLMEEGRYLRTEFVDGSSGEASIGEFYFTPDDTTIQFRVATSQTTGATKQNNVRLSRSKSNMDLCEAIRNQARFTKVPVLRNRRRLLFFGESALDTFGPGSGSLGPPAEMESGEIEGRQDLNFCDQNGFNCLPFGIGRNKQER
jgi:hypothetical protein